MEGTGRPHVIINCAMSADGKIALPTRAQTRISSPEDIVRVHALRASVDAILVGVETVLADDPSLTVKQEHAPGGKNPLRVVLDSRLRTPPAAKVLSPAAKTLIATATDAAGRKLGDAEIVRCGSGRVDLGLLLQELHSRGIKRLLVEGGGRVIWSFLGGRMFDELNIYVGPLAIGGGPSPADGSGIKSLEEAVKLRLNRVERVGDGVLLSYSPA